MVELSAVRDLLGCAALSTNLQGLAQPTMIPHRRQSTPPAKQWQTGLRDRILLQKRNKGKGTSGGRPPRFYRQPFWKETPMEWREVVEHPSLQDLPFKIETNQWGEIVMTPATLGHSKYQRRIIKWFDGFQQGDVLPECPIQTSEGVKVADVAWGSIDFFKRNQGDMPCLPESPEIVIEVKSSSNTDNEMERKKGLYFQAGAKEVWFCDKQGTMRFFNPQGELERSGLFREFPGHIDIDVM
jgi:Uma2 family endonuclease